MRTRCTQTSHRGEERVGREDTGRPNCSNRTRLNRVLDCLTFKPTFRRIAISTDPPRLHLTKTHPQRVSPNRLEFARSVISITVSGSFLDECEREQLQDLENGCTLMVFAIMHTVASNKCMLNKTNM